MRSVALALASAIAAAGVALSLGTSQTVLAPSATETVYIRNLDQRDFSNAQLKRDIPAWERAANTQFAPVWKTPHVKIVVAHGRIPHGAIVATFKAQGPIQGALAFHTLVRGVPAIIVYSGVNTFYGYSISESFTHELFETLADEFVNGANVGSLFASEIYVGQKPYAMPMGAVFFNEVCDPIEAYGYQLDGVQISDFVTPNYFGDGTLGGFDYMNVLTHPYQVARGGYTVYVVDGHWYGVVNFRHSGKDAAGFYKAEKSELGSVKSELRPA